MAMSIPPETPRWLESALGKYTSGVSHAFVFHFNTRDLVVPGASLKGYLAATFKNTEVVAFYDRSQGITFALPSMKKTFVEAAGLAQPGGSEDPTVAILRQMQGGGQSGEIQLPTDPSGALPMLETVLRQSNAGARRMVLVVDFAETIVPAADKSMMSPADRTNLVTLCRWGTDPAIVASGNIIILMTQNLAEIHPDVRAASSKYESVLIPLPDYEARADYIEYLYTQYPEIPVEVNGLELAAMTAGLSRMAIEDIFLRAKSEGTLTVDMVRERKAEIIASEYAEVLEIVEPEHGFETVGGHELAKKFFRKNVVEPIRSGNAKRVPLGVLLTGPAGTGKTYFAHAVAKESGINCVELRLEKLLGGIVGTSERNLARALQAIETLAPCIVFVDELDQKFRRGGSGASDGGSSVNNNLFAKLLEFLGDGSHRGKIVFIGATNRPDLLDAALKRPGRFDRRIPFLAPGVDDRWDIVVAMMRKHGIAFGMFPDKELTLMTEGWTGAELEMLVLKAWEIAQDSGRQQVDQVDLRAARERLSPSTADVEFMTAIAIRECNDTDLLPEQYRSQLRDRATLERTIEGFGQTRKGREL